jgi:hypothetical protein
VARCVEMIGWDPLVSLEMAQEQSCRGEHIRPVALVILHLHTLKGNILSGHQDFAVQHEFFPPWSPISHIPIKLPPAGSVVWTSLGPLSRWVPGPTTWWAPGTTRLALHDT